MPLHAVVLNASAVDGGRLEALFFFVWRLKKPYDKYHRHQRVGR
jgi:hypothetical protein